MLISVTLRIAGDFLDPEEITSILQVSPHSAQRKGSVMASRSKKEVVAKVGFWEWQSNDESKTLTINDHISRFKNTFEHAYEHLSKLPNAENAWLDVHMVVEDKSRNSTEVWYLMDVESISTLRSMGVPVEFTIDVLSSDEETPDN